MGEAGEIVSDPYGADYNLPKKLSTARSDSVTKVPWPVNYSISGNECKEGHGVSGKNGHFIGKGE